MGKNPLNVKSEMKEAQKYEVGRLTTQKIKLFQVILKINK